MVARSSQYPVSHSATSPLTSTYNHSTKGPLAPRSANYHTSPAVKSSTRGNPWQFKAEQMPSTEATGRVQDAENSQIPDLCPVSALGDHASTDYSLSEIDFPEDNSHPTKLSAAADSLSPEPSRTLLSYKAPESARSRTSTRSAHRSSPTHQSHHTEEVPQFNDDEADAVLGAYAPGDATMLESEEFSMISVDSLPSRRTGHSSPSQPLHTTEHDVPADRSYMPSSPPAFDTDRTTPVPEISTPTDPQAPPPMQSHDANVATPLRESARKSGRALQDALNGPFRESVSRELPVTRESIFAGFSSGNRRQPRQSPASQSFGAPAVQNVPHLAPTAHTFPNYLSPFQSPVRQPTESEVQTNRLLTPETDAPSQSRSNSRSSSQLQRTVEYPRIESDIQEAQRTDSARKNGEMSWIETESNPQTTSFNQLRSPPRSSPQSEPVISQQSVGSADAEEEDDRDIWQEEASRSLIDDQGSPQQTDLFLEDLPVKPRRGKLPGTWRRTSGAPFSYSDSPDPQERQDRKISASTVNSSRKSSGVMTPPSSEDGNVSTKNPSVVQTGQNVEEPEFEEIERTSTPSEVLSQVSEHDSIASGDDTGLFWQVNLPAVYSKSRNVSDSAKGSFAPSSPLRNTILDISPMKPTHAPGLVHPVPVVGQAKLSPNSAAIPTPLRQSLLKSSKMRGSPVARHREDAQDMGKGLNVEHDISGTQTDSSLASDAQQIQREMRRQTSTSASTVSLASGSHHRESKRHTSASTIDLTVSSASEREDSVASSQGDFSSYQEELNLNSPVRIKVNFNDSDGNSTLLEPKKHYPPLFDNVPSLSKPSTFPAEPPQPKSPIAKLTESFWEAVTKPPVYSSPERKPAVIVEPAAPNSVPDHVLRLRRKYGLLPDTHAFTYAHIRTLHRMLNSSRTRPENSIIPRSGPLNHNLSRLLGKTKTNELDQRFIFTQQHLHVIDSFMSLLLPQHERERLQCETGTWGDVEAIRHRGRDSKGRYGDEVVFKGVKGGVIEAGWVADVLVDIVFKEEMNVRKKKVADMLARAERLES